MITEFIIAAGLVGAYRGIEGYYKDNKWKTKDIKEDIKTFNQVCAENEINFYLVDGRTTKYGTQLIVSLRYSDYEKLEKTIGKFEIAFETDIELEQNENKITATMDIMRNKQNDKHNKFKPVEVKPYEVYLGEDNKFNSLVINFNTTPHLICSGSSGSGKSEELKLILSNSIYYNNEDDLLIHICNVGNTGDFDDFINCKQVKSFTESYEDIYKQFQYINHIYDNRMDTFRRYKVKNIKQYNDKFGNTVKKMPYVLLVIDEIASLYPSSSIDKYKEIKEELFNCLCDMGRRFRKVGVNLVLGIQRPSKAVFNPELKQNIGVKISGNQNNNASSLVATDSDKVTKIGSRNFLVEYDCEEKYLRSLYITDNMINQYIKPSIIPNRQSQPDFNVFLKLKQQNEESTITETEDKDNKPKAKAKAKTTKKKDKVVELEVAPTESKETKVRKATVEEIDGYDIVNGHICIKIHRRVE